MNLSIRLAALPLAVAFLLALPVGAQTYTLPASVVSSGGTHTSGSGYTLRGTVGQVGGFSSGASGALGAGFWYQAAHLEAGRLLLVEAARAEADSAAACRAAADPGAAVATAEAATSSLSGGALPAEVALAAPYPNPAASRATLRFALPEAAPVRLALYDALGRRVALLADHPHEAGWHEVALDGRALAPGLYLARLEVGGAVRTQRLTLVR